MNISNKKRLNRISGGGRVFIIAEAGVNHNGSFSLAKKMIIAAKKAGADAVKFQTFKADKLVTATAPKAYYQKKRDSGKTQLDMLKKLELSGDEFRQLKAYCGKIGIMFLSTPFDTESAQYLDRIGMKAFKISSGDLTNIPFLSQVAKYKKPIILSTGMATLEEVMDAVNAVHSAGNRKLTLLHCTSNYPTVPEDVNLLAMKTLKDRFNVPVGYSDHTEGVDIPVAAAAIGAVVIEKHFTLDKKMPGPDNSISLEPKELRAMIASIRRIEKALGDGRKTPRRSEMKMRSIARKSVVARVSISKGTRITGDMLSIKRPGTGVAPKYLNRIIGKKAKRDISPDSVIDRSQI